MSTLSRLQQAALAGTVGATIAAVAIAGATGSNAAPAASPHSHGGPHWLHASTTHSKLVLGADSTPESSSVSSTVSWDPGSQPSSSGTSAANDPGEYDDPEFVDISATPGPCTPDDVDASRWSTRVTVTNPKDAGPLDYVALGVNFDDDSEDVDQYPHAGPLHLDAGETGSVVLTGPSDYFPEAIIVGGGISSDGLTAKVIGEVDLFDQADFLKVAKVCGDTTPTPAPYDEESGYSGVAGEGEPSASTATVTATVTVTRTQTVQVERPGIGEPPTPSPITTRLPVTG